jgi:hypothetical protein
MAAMTTSADLAKVIAELSMETEAIIAEMPYVTGASAMMGESSRPGRWRSCPGR